MTTYRILVVIVLLGMAAWLCYGAWLVGRDLKRRHDWNKKHFQFRRSTEQWMARWNA